MIDDNKSDFGPLDNKLPDFDQIAIELFRFIRGGMTQKELSESLGFSFNQVAKWEASEKRILWSDFVKLAILKKIDLSSAITATTFQGYSDDWSIMPILRDFQGSTSLSDFSNLISENRLKVARWLSGEVDIPLTDIFKIMHITRNNLDIFIEHIVPIHLLPLTYAFFQKQVKLTERLLDKPWLPLFLQLLAHPDCPQHDHVVTFMKDKLNIDQVLVGETIQELLSAKLLTINKSGFYQRPVRRLILPKERGWQSKSYWAKASSCALAPMSEDEKMNGENLSGFLVLSTSDNGWSKIKEQYKIFFESVQRILDQDEDAQSKVKIINMQILDSQAFKNHVELDKVEF